MIQIILNIIWIFAFCFVMIAIPNHLIFEIIEELFVPFDSKWNKRLPLIKLKPLQILEYAVTLLMSFAIWKK